MSFILEVTCLKLKGVGGMSWVTAVTLLSPCLTPVTHPPPLTLAVLFCEPLIPPLGLNSIKRRYALQDGLCVSSSDLGDDQCNKNAGYITDQ